MNAIQAYWDEPQASPQNKGGKHYLTEKNGEEGKGGYEQSPLEESKSSGFRVAMASHWLSVMVSHWLGCCWVRRKIFLPLARVCEVNFLSQFVNWAAIEATCLRAPSSEDPTFNGVFFIFPYSSVTLLLQLTQNCTYFNACRVASGLALEGSSSSVTVCQPMPQFPHLYNGK